MKATLNDLLNAKGVSEPLREAVKALINRLEAAESDALEQARLNGMGASREAALMAKLEAAEKDIALKERIIDSLGSELNAVANERDELLARIREMEQQEPVAWAATDETCRVVEALSFNQSRRFDTPLYALPGAQGEEK